MLSSVKDGYEGTNSPLVSSLGRASPMAMLASEKPVINVATLIVRVSQLKFVLDSSKFNVNDWEWLPCCGLVRGLTIIYTFQTLSKQMDSSAILVQVPAVSWPGKYDRVRATYNVVIDSLQTADELATL